MTVNISLDIDVQVIIGVVLAVVAVQKGRTVLANQLFYGRTFFEFLQFF